ncbi:hypothetical protein BJ875DRAFT_493178 [Amylocarpus encephaloides]|uniref:Uncharacterized protein n=1 Tax=Amylocarpus encephaloides TaxID=45428 RepID=A0A9P8C894_9HELO|nr:hypothetical protein BJ875DRAFT_493178 [Amylocarpus encephaloides]
MTSVNSTGPAGFNGTPEEALSQYQDEFFHQLLVGSDPSIFSVPLALYFGISFTSKPSIDTQIYLYFRSCYPLSNPPLPQFFTMPDQTENTAFIAPNIETLRQKYADDPDGFHALDVEEIASFRNLSEQKVMQTRGTFPAWDEGTKIEFERLLRKYSIHVTLCAQEQEKKAREVGWEGTREEILASRFRQDGDHLYGRQSQATNDGRGTALNFAYNIDEDNRYEPSK